MSIADKFAELAFDFARRSSDDEYQEDIWYKSAAVSYFTFPLSLYSLGAVLAWALPSYYTLLSVLIIFPLIFAEMVGQAWMRERAPRPRAHINSTFMKITTIPLIAMFFGIAFRLANAGDGDMAWGVIIGAGVGGAAAAYFTPRMLAAVRKKDEDRFDAELDD